jgi:hypothetical protein
VFSKKFFFREKKFLGIPKILLNFCFWFSIFLNRKVFFEKSFEISKNGKSGKINPDSGKHSKVFVLGFAMKKTFELLPSNLFALLEIALCYQIFSK